MTEKELEVIKRIGEENIHYICLTFCDVLGHARNVTLMPGELPRAFESGIALDASGITGFKTDAKIDLLLRPDANTFADLPETLTHENRERIKRMFCSVFYPDGRPFENDTRAILRAAEEKAEKKGLHFNIGPSMEFYLFRDNGDKLVSYDDAGYMACFPDDRCEEIRRELCMGLSQMGIQPECAYHEAGPGQNKIKFHFADPVEAADAVIAYQGLVRTVAANHGLVADFSPKPLERQQGNSLHVNMSVEAEDGADRTPHMIAGILQKISEMTLFLNPSKESFRRLGRDNAPKFITWSDANRSTLIRIPAYGGYTRFELRSPDCFANPYLAFALLIDACLFGIEEKPELQKATEVDLFDMDNKNLPKLRTLPLSLSDAQGKVKNSIFIAKSLPKSIVEVYMNL